MKKKVIIFLLLTLVGCSIMYTQTLTIETKHKAHPTIDSIDTIKLDSIQFNPAPDSCGS